MKKTPRFTYGLLLTVILLTLLTAALYPAESVSALAPAPAAASVPQPLEPNKVIKVTTPTYRWTKVSGATSYSLQVLNEYNNTVVYNSPAIPSSVCYSEICSYTPLQKMGRFGYRWRVKISNSTTWSSLFTFYIRGESFSNYFTYGLQYWWQRKSGGKWIWEYPGGTRGWLVSEGLPDKCSAAVHHTSSTYDNFTVQTRLKITGAEAGGKYPEAYLALRMKNSVDITSQCWYGGYLFGYSRDGKYSFWKMEKNGAWTDLIPPTHSNLVKPSDWNVIKVYANKNTFNLFINDELIASVTDSSYPIGYIGFEMVNHGSVPTKFYADWITVNMLP